MSKDIKIKKGLNINLKGEAEKTLSKAPRAATFAIRPKDFHLVTPKMVIKEGASFKAGEVLFYDNNNATYNSWNQTITVSMQPSEPSKHSKITSSADFVQPTKIGHFNFGISSRIKPPSRSTSYVRPG